METNGVQYTNDMNESPKNNVERKNITITYYMMPFA